MQDPVVRYSAGAVLVIAFAGAMLVAVHGYWVDPTYQLPPLLSAVLTSGVGGALALLGVHVGGQGVSTGVQVMKQNGSGEAPAQH